VDNRLIGAQFKVEFSTER